MRVLRLVSRPNVGGPMRQAVALYHAHQQMGVQTLLVVGRCEGGEPEVPLQDLGIPMLGLHEALSRGDKAAGIVQLDSLRRGFHPVLDRHTCRTLLALMETFAPRFVHTHTTKAGWLGRRAIAAAHAGVGATARTLSAHTFHGHVLRDYFARPVAAWLAAKERRLARQTDLLFAVSPSCREELDELRVVSGDRVQVLPAAVETARFAAVKRSVARLLLAEHGVPLQHLVLGFIGRLVPIKQPAVFQELVASLPGTVGVVLGEGPGRAMLHHPALHCLGAVPNPEDFLAGIDILVLPSLREGCPLVAVEAFAAGVPVVGFDVPGVRDVLSLWGAGVLVPLASGVAGLNAAINSLRSEPERAAALREQARQALPRFDPTTIAGEMLKAYRSAEQGPGAVHA